MMIYVYWYNDCGCEIGCEGPFTDVAEAQNVISHWVPNMEPGDTFKMKDEA